MSHKSSSYCQQFLTMMATEKRATRATLSAVDSDLRNFSHFIDQPFEKMTSQDIQDYLVTQNHLAPSTVARRLSSLRQFYAFLVSEGALNENPLSFLQPRSYKSKPATAFSKEDVTRLLGGAKTWGGVEGKRLSALLHLLYCSHISVNDLVSLPVANALMREDLVLQEYMAVRDHFLGLTKDSPWLFPSSSQSGHLTRQRFGQLVKELSLKVGLDPSCITLSKIRQG